ncbi:MAG: ERCC4 domain-containing protein [Candidatus Micrarchaeia archaeon]
MSKQTCLQRFIGDNPPQITILMDVREPQEIKDMLVAGGAVVKSESLPAGDYLLSERVAVERKTREDFESSIIDGRIFEQLTRLKSNFDCVILVVEGEKFENRLSRNALLGALSAMIVDIGVSLIFTRNTERTAELLFAIAKREQTEKRTPVRLRGDKKALTIPQYQQMIVEGLPLVGPTLARKLLMHFGTVENIFKASEKELMAVDGLGRKRAKLIRRLLTCEYIEADEKQKL